MSQRKKGEIINSRRSSGESTVRHSQELPVQSIPFFSLKNRLSTLLIRSWASNVDFWHFDTFFVAISWQWMLDAGKADIWKQLRSYLQFLLQLPFRLTTCLCVLELTCCICICVVVIFVFAFVFVFFTSWNEVEGESAYHPHWCSP